jgi:hypothetical protein
VKTLIGKSHRPGKRRSRLTGEEDCHLADLVDRDKVLGRRAFAHGIEQFVEMIDAGVISRRCDNSVDFGAKPTS